MANPEFETIIIGTGFGGLAIGYELKKAGKDNFLYLEKADGVGGTWRENTYPGAKCDNPSIFYSFSWAPNPDWQYKWSRQSQILQYIKDLYKKFDLERHLQFNTKVLGAEFDEENTIWRVETDRGPLTCRYLVSSVGQLHYPNLPKLDGIDDFSGPSFHSAEWNHTVDYSDKDIAVVGSAASAIQIIPEIAKSAKKLTVYQRTPNWILDQGDYAYSKFAKWLARYMPIFRRMHLALITFKSETILHGAINGSKKWSDLLVNACLDGMKSKIQDSKLQQALTPNFPLGAKRLLFSDHYYQALNRENVNLITTGINKITPNGVQDVSGEQREHDLIVYATGFKTNPFLLGLDIRGCGGKKLSDHWANGAHAYLSITTSNFPNLFFTYGPNSNTGHHSIVFKLETQARYIEQLINNTLGKTRIEVKPDVEEKFNDEMQTRLSKMAWSKVEASWYKVGDRITNNWPGTGKEFKKRLRTPNWSDFQP